MYQNPNMKDYRHMQANGTKPSEQRQDYQSINSMNSSQAPINYQRGSSMGYMQQQNQMQSGSMQGHISQQGQMQQQPGFTYMANMGPYPQPMGAYPVQSGSNSNKILYQQMKLIFNLMNDQNRDMIERLQKQNSRIIKEYKMLKGIFSQISSRKVNMRNSNCQAEDLELDQEQCNSHNHKDPYEVMPEQSHLFIDSDLPMQREDANYNAQNQGQENLSHLERRVRDIQDKKHQSYSQNQAYYGEQKGHQAQYYQQVDLINPVYEQAKTQHIPNSQQNKLENSPQGESQMSQDSYLVDEDQKAQKLIAPNSHINLERSQARFKNRGNPVYVKEKQLIRQFMDKCLVYMVEYDKSHPRPDRIKKSELEQNYHEWRQQNFLGPVPATNSIDIKMELSTAFKEKFPDCINEIKGFRGIKFKKDYQPYPHVPSR